MITVNGKEVKDQEEQTVADYLEENGYRMNRIAVELNGGMKKFFRNTAIQRQCSKTVTVWRL